MFAFPGTWRVYLAVEPVDMRKHFDGLWAEVEQRLGARLLHRSTRGVTPTEVGSLYYERCKSIVRDFDEAVEISARSGSASTVIDSEDPREWSAFDVMVTATLGLQGRADEVRSGEVEHPVLDWFARNAGFTNWTQVLAAANGAGEPGHRRRAALQMIVVTCETLCCPAEVNAAAVRKSHATYRG